MVSLTNNFFIKGIGSLFNYFQNNENSEKNTKEIENNFEKIKEDFLNLVKQKIEQNQEIYFQNEIASKYNIEKLDDLIKKIYNNENISKLIKEKFFQC